MAAMSLYSESPDIGCKQEFITRSVHLVLYMYDGVSSFCAIFWIPSHCLIPHSPQQNMFHYTTFIWHISWLYYVPQSWNYRENIFESRDICLNLVQFHLTCVVSGYKIIIIGHSKCGRFGAILNSFTLSKMHHYWLLKVGVLLLLWNS